MLSLQKLSAREEASPEVLPPRWLFHHHSRLAAMKGVPSLRWHFNIPQSSLGHQTKE